MPGPDAPDRAREPELDEADALLARLAELGELLDVRHCASAHQLAWAEDLPDAWVGDLVSLRTLLRRLLRYAGEDDKSLPVVLEDGRALAFEGLGDRFNGELDYLGWIEGRAHFGVHALGDLRAMLGPACVEIGRAVVHHAMLATRSIGYRDEHHELATEDLPDPTDGFLASFLLGFGVPVTNACHDFRADERFESGMTRGAWRRGSLGFPPDLAAWLLAVVYRASERDAAFVEAHEAKLNPNQRQAFEQAWTALEGEQAQLRAALRWPEPDAWDPPAAPAREPLEPDEQDDALEDAEAERRLALRRPNAGEPVFRVRPRQTLPLGLAGLVIGAVSGLLFGGGWLGFGLFGLIVGGVGGRRVRGSHCSEPECQVKIPVHAAQCPGCGGTVAGDIDRANQRLDARERLEQARARGLGE